MLLSVASGDKNLERRLVAILALRYSEDRQVGDALVKLLDDEKTEAAALQRMSVRKLRARYADVLGEETRAGNKAWLIKRIAGRPQSLADSD